MKLYFDGTNLYQWEQGWKLYDQVNEVPRSTVIYTDAITWWYGYMPDVEDRAMYALLQEQMAYESRSEETAPFWWKPLTTVASTHRPIAMCYLRKEAYQTLCAIIGKKKTVEIQPMIPKVFASCPDGIWRWQWEEDHYLFAVHDQAIVYFSKGGEETIPEALYTTCGLQSFHIQDVENVQLDMVDEAMYFSPYTLQTLKGKSDHEPRQQPLWRYSLAALLCIGLPFFYWMYEKESQSHMEMPHITVQQQETSSKASRMLEHLYPLMNTDVTLSHFSYQSRIGTAELEAASLKEALALVEAIKKSGEADFTVHLDEAHQEGDKTFFTLSMEEKA